MTRDDSNVWLLWWSAFLVPWFALYLLPWNPIYPGIVALAIGGAASFLCRPDPARNTLLGGVLFASMYAVFMILLLVSAPGYVEQVWNPSALSGIRLGAVPLEVLAFGLAFGMYCAGSYEQFTWKRGARSGAREQASLGGQHG